MKKTLLICTALVIGSTAFAQNGRQTNQKLRVSTMNKNARIDADAFPAAGTKNQTGPASQKSSSVCTPVKFTSGPNVLTLIGNGSTQQNVLSYNKDLNTVLFTHRRSADWAFSGKTSGAIQSTWLDLGTNKWDSMIIYRDSAAKFAGRFPGGVHFNPVGNTNLSGSYMAAGGPTIHNTAFTGSFRATRQVTGNYHNIPANDVDTFAVGGLPFGYMSGYLNNGDFQQVGNNLYFAAGFEDHTMPSANVSIIKGGALVKATYAGGNFVWSIDSTSFIPGFYNAGGASTNGYASMGALCPRVRFDPSGNIGYFVLFGTLAATAGNSSDSMVSPIVYKTTNGGTTWAPVMTGYDWNSAHPECLKNCFEPKLGAPKNFSFGYSYYQTMHGLDMTVDAAGTLHLVTTVNAVVNDGASKDSMNYGYPMGYWNYTTSHPIIWDFMTDGSCWKTMMVDSIISSFVGDASTDTTRLANPWEAGASSGSYYGYGAHLTVARSTDGTKIIYGWGDSDPTSTGVIYNNAPDMIMKAYDITTHMMTPTTNVTNGIGACYYSFISDYAYFDGTQSKWVAPFVYTIGRVTTTQGFDGNQPVNFFYGNCGAFGASDFTIPATINNDLITPACAVGIKTNNNFVAAVNNYPNPFNHTTNIVVSLNDASAISVNVYDALGNLVFNKKMNGNVGDNTIVFDGSSLAAGVYHYTVNTGNQKITKKMIIQK